MLADPAHVLAESFDVLIAADGVAERGAFIVEPKSLAVVFNLVG